MSTIFKRIVGCLITLSLILFGVRKLDFIVRPTDTDSAYVQINNFHSMPENSLDVIIYGSSHAYNGVDPLELYSAYGIGAYNYGMKWQSISTTKLFLQDSLLSQNPKVVLIETYFANRSLSDSDINAEIFYTRYIHAKSELQKYLKKCFGRDPERYLSFYMPLCAFHDNWNSLTEKSFEPFTDIAKSNIRKNMGYGSSSRTKTVTLPKLSDVEQLPFDEGALGELDEIVSICQARGIEIVFFTVPYEMGYHYSDAMNRYAEEKGYPYLDLFQSIGELNLDVHTDFRNSGHLNDSGAKKVADYLGQYLVDHYDLEDTRRIEGNPWEQALANRKPTDSDGELPD